jgi:hypothetical protein
MSKNETPATLAARCLDVVFELIGKFTPAERGTPWGVRTSDQRAYARVLAYVLGIAEGCTNIPIDAAQLEDDLFQLRGILAGEATQ